jgi:serine/threonine protein kinase
MAKTTNFQNFPKKMEEKIIINNNWVKGKRIGKGGFGSIYLSTNIHSGKLAAIKIEDLRVSELLSGEIMILKAVNNLSKNFTLFNFSQIFINF